MNIAFNSTNLISFLCKLTLQRQYDMYTIKALYPISTSFEFPHFFKQKVGIQIWKAEVEAVLVN